MPRKNIKIQEPLKSADKRQGFIIGLLSRFIERLKRRHLRHYRDSYFHFWADLILLAILVGSLAIAVVLFFWQPTPNFIFTIHNENKIIKNNNVERFIINYKNNEAGPIADAAFTLVLPHYFVIKNIQPSGHYDEQSKIFTLGGLDKGAEGSVVIDALVRGEINEQQTLSAHLTYNYQSFRKEYLTSFDYQLNQSALSLRVEVPDNIYDQVKTPGKITITNDSPEKIDNISLLLDDQDWQIFSEENIWLANSFKINSLLSQESKELNFVLINKKTVGEKSFAFKIQQTIDDNLLTADYFSKNILISRPSLTLDFKTDRNNLSLPENLSAKINIKNQEADKISNLSLSLISSNRRIIFNNFSATGAAVNDEGLIYLGNLNPNEEKDINLSFNVDRKELVTNESFYPLINLRYKFNNEDFSYTVANTLIKIATNINVRTAGYYYSSEGDQLGIGPLPPQVGIPTTYWVTWEANNLGNDISLLNMSARLADNVAWGEQQVISAGDLTYNPSNRLITWAVKDISKNGGNYRVNFAITLLPTIKDIGTSPNLLENQSFVAKDAFTGQSLSKNLANITINITEDSLAKDKYKVIPQE